MLRTRLFVFAGLLSGVLVASGAATAQQPARPAAPAAGAKAAATPLPNGASSINESYGDWIVDCRLLEGEKQCIAMQAQGNNQTRQRIFEIQLQSPKDGKVEGTILMPFGLKLDNGAILSLDDKDLNHPLRFSTCTPQGCLLPVSFPLAQIETFKKGKALNVASLNMGNGEPVAFKVSLDGFASAMARVTELGK